MQSNAAQPLLEGTHAGLELPAWAQHMARESAHSPGSIARWDLRSPPSTLAWGYPP